LAAFRNQKNMAVPSHARARAPKVVPAVHPKAGSRSGRDRRSRNVAQSPLNDQGEQREIPVDRLGFAEQYCAAIASASVPELIRNGRVPTPGTADPPVAARWLP